MNTSYAAHATGAQQLDCLNTAALIVWQLSVLLQKQRTHKSWVVYYSQQHAFYVVWGL